MPLGPAASAGAAVEVDAGVGTATAIASDGAGDAPDDEKLEGAVSASLPRGSAEGARMKGAPVGAVGATLPFTVVDNATVDAAAAAVLAPDNTGKTPVAATATGAARGAPAGSPAVGGSGRPPTGSWPPRPGAARGGGGLRRTARA